ncbi:NUDIX hydrolase [Photobacterium galatheae]|uniref:ADP-ribose pyrophosphatase n=1 Tax=Photobacterium galatheae TaxID=1654360 RepID=A0A066RUQ2_9GAMM|nr:NUDIX hydrolase [Photobacterium galatheae]KDM92831.1 ADP-ribose pyrophosphatase [Photobacterium galatheae]MCM0148204.1 NUDIX hydrolase [Photobacterium galatheae]
MADPLVWAKQLQAIAQAGKAYSQDPYDLERFDQIAVIAQQMFAELSDAPLAKIQNLFIPETGYPTPKVDLRAGVIRENRILLVREREDDRWTLPGGWADVCETPSEGIVREVMEESGLVVGNPRLVAIKDRSVHPYQPAYPNHIYKLFFLCDYISGEPSENLEISKVAFFERHAIPPLSLSRVLAEDIAMMFCHCDDLQLPIQTD